jgi:hypothetical protein
MCKEKNTNVFGIIGGSVVVVVLAAVVYFNFVRRRGNAPTQSVPVQNALPIAIEEAVTPVAPPPPFAPK